MVALNGKIEVATVHGVKDQVPSGTKSQPCDSPDQPRSRLALIVEDSITNQKLLERMLHQQGFEVITAGDGREGLQKLRQQHVDVVLMDVEMPVMDGLEATRRIRQQETKSHDHTPIIAVTAGADRETCLDAGVDEFIAKPAKVSELQEVLDRYCK